MMYVHFIVVSVLLISLVLCHDIFFQSEKNMLQKSSLFLFSLMLFLLS